MIDSRFYDISGPISLGKLLEGLAVEPFPNENFRDELIEAPADLSKAIAGQISFLANKRRKSDVETSKATACFVTERLAPVVAEKSIIPIISKTPRAHFGRVVGRLARQKMLGNDGGFQKSSSARVHASAVIGVDAIIGDDVYIGPYTIIGPGVQIGNGTVIEGHTRISCALIGSNSLIKSGAQIGGDGFGMDGDENGIVNLPHIGRAILGDRVFIGSQSCVDRGFLGDTHIGNDVKIDNLVQVAHNCTIGDGTMIAGHAGLSGSCKIGKNVRLGGAVGIADHITIGDGAQIAASSGVMHNIPAGEYWGGTPATPARDQIKLLAATRKLIEKKKS